MSRFIAKFSNLANPILAVLGKIPIVKQVFDIILKALVFFPPKLTPMWFKSVRASNIVPVYAPTEYDDLISS